MTPDPFDTESEYVKRPDAQRHLKVIDALREWDPIGVLRFDPNWSRDEYDGYASTLIGMLDRRATVDEMVEWMRYAASHTMGLRSFDEPLCRRLTRDLASFWEVTDRRD